MGGVEVGMAGEGLMLRFTLLRLLCRFWPPRPLPAAQPPEIAMDIVRHALDRLDDPPRVIDVTPRLQRFERRWRRAWETAQCPGLWLARPYPHLDDEAAWARLDELLYHIEAEVMP